MSAKIILYQDISEYICCLETGLLMSDPYGNLHVKIPGACIHTHFKNVT